MTYVISPDMEEVVGYEPFKESAVVDDAKEKGEALDIILKTRSNSHGPFHKQARISQTLKETLVDVDLTSYQREALEMIFHKISRVLAGNPDFSDHWVDIAGYATLVARELEDEGQS